jgi:hypothetical protein
VYISTIQYHSATVIFRQVKLTSDATRPSIELIDSAFTTTELIAVDVSSLSHNILTHLQRPSFPLQSRDVIAVVANDPVSSESRVAFLLVILSVITLDADTESVTSVVNVPSFANIESVRMFTDSTGPMKVAPSVTLIRCTSASRTDSSEIVASRVEMVESIVLLTRTM